MTFRSNRNPVFRSKFSEDIFNQKYAHAGCETWDDLCRTLVEEVGEGLMSPGDRQALTTLMQQAKVFPGGRYLYYAGRAARFYNNCYLLKAEEDKIGRAHV